MFIIKKISDSSLHYWTNLRTDNFAKFLPKNLETSLEDIKIYLLPDNVKNKVEELGRIPIVKEESGVISLELYEETIIITEDDNGQPLEEPIINYNNLLETIPTKLIEYPYDEDGNFIEPAEFIPQP